jgi:hypothetical protein
MILIENYDYGTIFLKKYIYIITRENILLSGAHIS